VFVSSGPTPLKKDSSLADGGNCWNHLRTDDDRLLDDRHTSPPLADKC